MDNLTKLNKRYILPNLLPHFRFSAPKLLDNMKFILALLLIILIQFIFIPIPKAYAATTPAFGQAASFGILSSTYTNTAGGTTINGDLGYTTGPAVAPTVNGTTYSALTSKYSTAGTHQSAALAALASQACTHTFPAGAVDLATDTSHGTIGVYAPGVYCTAASSAASIGAGGVTLSGSGTYIFRITGALTTVANSVVTLAGNASTCNVFWTPTAATTLGANSTFAGTDIDAAGITIGSTVGWTGRALAFGGTVSTDVDTITVPTCNGASNTAGGNTDDALTAARATGGPTAPFCPAIGNQVIAPNITESRRVSPTSIFLSWGPNSGVNTFIVQYGLEDGSWLYSTNVTGFSTTINDLPANQPIWFRVAARNDCTVGTYGGSKLVGGSTGGPTIAGQNPNVLGVSFPNTGFAPYENNILWCSY